MADTEDTETLADAEMEALAVGIHEARLCNCDSGDGDRMVADRLASTVERIIAARLLARDERIRADERDAWASWLETWLSAVGAEPPTAEAVVRWLRADTRPFGCSANTALAGEVEGAER